MTYWIFKVADQELYPDVPGGKYVYDNTHSTRVQRGDLFNELPKEYSSLARRTRVQIETVGCLFSHEGLLKQSIVELLWNGPFGRVQIKCAKNNRI